MSFMTRDTPFRSRRPRVRKNLAIREFPQWTTAEALHHVKFDEQPGDIALADDGSTL